MDNHFLCVILIPERTPFFLFFILILCAILRAILCAIAASAAAAAVDLWENWRICK
jgi:hypothetical protein